MRYLLLAVLMLASVLNVQAGAVFTIASAEFDSNCASMNIGVPPGGAQLTDPGNGVKGMKVYGQASATCGGTFDYPSISFSAYGNVAVDDGGFPASLAVSWDFTSTLNSLDAGHRFSLSICAGNDCRASFSLEGTWNSGVAVTGQGFLLVDDGRTDPWSLDDRWNVNLSIYDQNLNLPLGTVMTLNIPASSIDINPSGGNAAIPEPASWGLLAGGLGALALLRRRFS